MLPAEKPSLYDRLGGVYSIATRLNANLRVNEAHHRVPPAGFKYLVTEMVCWAAGGPQKYTGRSMVDSHAHLKITSREWESLLDDFQQTLDKFAIGSGEQAELKAIINSTRSDMLGEELNASEVTSTGLLGHRAYALIDNADGKVAACPHRPARRHARP